MKSDQMYRITASLVSAVGGPGLRFKQFGPRLNAAVLKYSWVLWRPHSHSWCVFFPCIIKHHKVWQANVCSTDWNYFLTNNSRVQWLCAAFFTVRLPGLVPLCLYRDQNQNLCKKLIRDQSLQTVCTFKVLHLTLQVIPTIFSKVVQALPRSYTHCSTVDRVVTSFWPAERLV